MQKQAEKIPLDKVTIKELANSFMPLPKMASTLYFETNGIIPGQDIILACGGFRESFNTFDVPYTHIKAFCVETKTSIILSFTKQKVSYIITFYPKTMEVSAWIREENGDIKTRKEEDFNVNPELKAMLEQYIERFAAEYLNTAQRFAKNISRLSKYLTEINSI